MHIYTIHEVALAALRLVTAGMALRHAVSESAAAFGFDPDLVYREIARIESNHPNGGN